MNVLFLAHFATHFLFSFLSLTLLICSLVVFETFEGKGEDSNIGLRGKREIRRKDGDKGFIYFFFGCAWKRVTQTWIKSRIE